ncbi:MAG: DUF4982 domain-containing protein [Oscillospiraceae bacterium]|jgi:beta-galactosidase|nr:DUF4982 domain-containing protein [Oscillospiraceae bacterium]
MKKIPLNLNWTRRITSSGGDGVPVDLPDDFILNLQRTPDAVSGAASGFFPGGSALYTKNIDVPLEWSGRSALLDIDGAYMNAEVKLNGQSLGVHPYGYTPWQIDVTDALIHGEANELEIATRCVQPNSRWYSGGGLYREVGLWLGGPVHIKPWDVFVSTAGASERTATARVSAYITNALSEPLRAKARATVGDQFVEKYIDLPPASRQIADFDVTISNPKLWSAESPNLVDLIVSVETDQGGDEHRARVGIRNIEIDAKRGMRVNGVPVKLRGGCIHHDNALLGAAAYPRAEERKIQLLKEQGYNAIRCAHNPPSSALLDACDALGMYVLDETFDCWVLGKNDQDYHLYFRDWWKRDTEAMVLRDRNHPCVFCWSIGNEVIELGGVSDGSEWADKQARVIRSLDPTRPVTAAFFAWIRSARAKGEPSRTSGSRPDLGFDMDRMLNDPSVSAEEIHAFMLSRQDMSMMDGVVDGEDVFARISSASADALDAAGYNYLYKRYALDAKRFPDRVIIATETHASNTYDYYRAMMDNPNVIGDFIWTAYDNLGEAGAGRVMRGVKDLKEGMLGPWPWLSCFQGDLDLDGNRRPQSYYRGIMWGMDDGIHLFVKPPEHVGATDYGLGWQWDDVCQSWTWPEWIGKPIDVQAYADCDEVEFILNGKSVGTSKPDKLKAYASLEYQPGALEAVARRGGKIVARTVLRTAGAPARIELTADRANIDADGMDLCFIKARLTDSDGATVPTDAVELSVRVEGGALAGFGSGNPRTDENYGTGKRRVWNGQALIAVRAPSAAGEITVTVSGAGLPRAALNIITSPREPARC